MIAFTTPPTLENWYPDRLRVEMLHQNGPQANPLGPDFDYRAAFAALDALPLEEGRGYLRGFANILMKRDF